jgi:hypothetical protein
MDLGEPRLGDEEPHEDIFRRQQGHHRPAGGDGLAGAGENVGDDAADRRGDVALVEPPLQHVDRCARRLGGRLLRLDLALASKRRTHLCHRRFEALDLGNGRAQVGALLVDELDGHRVRFHQGLVAPEIGLDLVARGLGVRQIGFRLLDFGQLAAGLEIGELLLGLPELPRSLLLGGPIGGVVLFEQGRAGSDLRAALDGEGGEEALLGRPDLDVIGLGIALPLNRRRVAVLPPPARACRGRAEQHDCRYCRTVHGT